MSLYFAYEAARFFPQGELHSGGSRETGSFFFICRVLRLFPFPRELRFVICTKSSSVFTFWMSFDTMNVQRASMASDDARNSFAWVLSYLRLFFLLILHRAMPRLLIVSFPVGILDTGEHFAYSNGIRRCVYPNNGL